MSARRLFFALWPDAAMREALWNATRPALANAHGGRAVPADNLHVTLAFLGAVPESSLATLRELAGTVARDIACPAPLDVTLDTIDHWRRAQILCATAGQACLAAGDLAERLRGALVTGGFAPDLKPFRVHVTLARQVRSASPGLRMPPVPWRFDDFALIESRTGPEGSSYSMVESWVLGGRGGAVARPPMQQEKP
jgi:RNA 2',3'-cyclic 3'-phosphodiesterase